MNVIGARSVFTNVPRSFMIGTGLRNTDCAAVAPIHTRIFGLMSSSSASSHGLQAMTSLMSGFWCFRRLPWGVHLKCLTALLT